MNVNDQWMLERMQQMAANMSLPQTSQNTDASKPEKGESFQDMMEKAKDQKVEAPKKDSAPEKKQPVQKKEQPQKVGQSPKEGDNTSRVNLDSNTAALVAAGYAQVLEVFEDGSALILLDAEKIGGGFSIMNGGLLPEGQELTPVTITNASGEKVTIPPEQLQEVFDQLGVDGPQKSDKGITLVGQLDLNGHQDSVVYTMDGKITTLREAMAEAGEQDDTDLNSEVMTAKEPLFHDVKATPVKVGDNFQLDTQEPDMDANLADTIRFAAQQGLRQIEIKLSPENLGTLTVKLTQSSDGTLQVVLHAANAKAANLLTQHIDNLNAALQGYNENNEVHVEVQRGENSQQAQQQTDPDGRNQQQQQQQQQRQQESEHSGDFIQKLRLGLYGLDDMI